jgi:hypothetical protein
MEAQVKTKVRRKIVRHLRKVVQLCDQASSARRGRTTNAMRGELDLGDVRFYVASRDSAVGVLSRFGELHDQQDQRRAS